MSAEEVEALLICWQVNIMEEAATMSSWIEVTMLDMAIEVVAVDWPAIWGGDTRTEMRDWTWWTFSLRSERL